MLLVHGILFCVFVVCLFFFLFFFFFSSRRRHTRSYGDWSSDVCSSDLSRSLADASAGVPARGLHGIRRRCAPFSEDRGVSHSAACPQTQFAPEDRKSVV